MRFNKEIQPKQPLLGTHAENVRAISPVRTLPLNIAYCSIFSQLGDLVVLPDYNQEVLDKNYRAVIVLKKGAE